MAIDPRIALGVQPFQLENPVNQLARVMQVQNMQQDQQLGRMKMDEYQRATTDRNRLSAILQGGGDAEALRKGGFLKESLDWDKANADRAKATADTAKAQSEALTKRMNFYRERIPADPKGAAAWLAAQHNDDVLGPLMKRIGSLEADISTIPTDPQAFEQWRNQQALGMGEFLKANAPKYQTQDSGQVSSILALPGLGGAPQTVSSVQKVMTPGEVATDKRAAATLAEQRRHNQATEANQVSGRGQFLETPDGYVLGDPRSGKTTPVMGADGQPLKGKAANRQMTDSQAKANLFGSRMAESHRILTELEGQYSPMAVNAKMAASEVPLIGGAAGYAGNLMLSEQGQQAEQAQRDFINAVLRRESGAVISAPEFANGQKQYFPQPGDTKAVLDQKRRNRELAIQGMAAEVPGGLRMAPALTNPGGKPGSSPGRSASGVIDFSELK